MESLANTDGLMEIKPVKGANLFLAGGGKLLFAFSTPLVFSSKDLKAYFEVDTVRDAFFEELEEFGITEDDVINLLNGSLSIVFGSEVVFMGEDIPGGYIAITGREGAVSKIFRVLMDSVIKTVPLAPLRIAGWDSAYTVDPAVFPAPITFGVKQDTFLIGILDPDALAKIPELPSELTKMLDSPLFGVIAIDTLSIWNRMREEVANPNSILFMEPEMKEGKDFLEEILGADLSVPFIKMWYPELEISFLEISVVDVPIEKQLLPQLVKFIRMLM
jgi:hypothetical protein